MRADGGHASVNEAHDHELQTQWGVVRQRTAKSGAVAPLPSVFSADLKRYAEETSHIASEEQRLEESVEASSQLTLMPEGTLHVWVYQARRLVFRSVFAPMYDRHGLHLRCYLVSALGEQIGIVCESRKNYSGNMNNPLWRRPNDRARDRSRGHFELPVVSSPAFLLPTENTQLKIEIVCGILVVASAQMDLPALWEAKQLKTSDTQPQGDDYDDYVLIEPHWVSLSGEDTGAIEVMLEFCPCPESVKGSDQNEERGEFSDDEYDDDETPILASVFHEDNNAVANSGPAMMELYEEPQDQDDEEEAALVSAEYDSLEQRALMRRRRYEITDPRKLSTASTASSSACTVMITNNGTTTLYIPSQCQPANVSSSGPSSAITSFVADINPDASAQDRLMEKQLWDLYYNGISSDQLPPQSSLQSFMNRASSMMSHQSEYSSHRSETSSMFSRKASTCASDVLAYNELIQDMEMSLSAAAAAEKSAPIPGDAERIDETTKSIEADKEENPASSPTRVPWTYKKTELLNRHGKPIKSSLKKFAYSPFARNNNEPQGDGQPSSIQETRSKGVVLFDPDCLPRRLQASFEQNIVEADEEKKKKQMNLGRRRSVPVNQHLATAAAANAVTGRNNSTTSRSSNSSCSSNDSQRACRVGRAVSGDLNESPEMERPAVQRKRSASLHSLTDLYRQTTLRELEPRDHETAAERWMQRYQERHVLLPPESKKMLDAPLAMHDPAGRDRGDHCDSRVPPPIAPPRRNSNGSQNTIAINGSLLGVGKFIKVGKVTGVVRYIGLTHFASGTWIGIELCERKGKNNGSVKGCEYFTCAPDHGIFIRANRLDLSVE